MAYDLEEIAENIRRAHELLQATGASAPAAPAAAAPAAAATPPAAAPQETPRGRVPLQSPVTPGNAPRLGSGANPNVSSPGSSLEAQAYREALGTNPGPRPAAPGASVPAPGTGPAQVFQPNGPSLGQRVGEFLSPGTRPVAPTAVPPVGSGPAQVFQPNGPTVGQRVGEFLRSEEGGARTFQAAPQPVAPQPAPVNPQLRSVIEQAAQGDAANREVVRQRLGGGAQPTAAANPAPVNPTAMGGPAEGASPEQAFRDAVRARTAAAGGATPPVAPPGAPPVAPPAASAAATPAGGPAAAAQNRMVAPFRKVGAAARIAGPVAAGLDAINSMGAYHINDPTVDSSAGGTVNALKNGQFGAALSSAGQGLVETALDTGGFLAGLADILPFHPSVRQAYDEFLKSQMGDKVQVDHTGAITGAVAPGIADWVISHLGLDKRPGLRPEAQARVNAGETANMGNGAPRSATQQPVNAAPGQQIAQAATASTSAGQSDRARLLAALDAEEKADARRVLGAGSTNMADPASSYWSTADGRNIRKPVATTQDEKNLLDRLRVLDARGQGGTFEHEGRQYANVQYGLDSNGVPVYRALSMDGKPLGGREATDLLRRYDDIQKRTGPLAPDDSAGVATFEQRQRRREDINSMAQATAGEGGRPAGATGATPQQGGQKAASGGVAVRDTVGPKANGYVPFSFVQDPTQRAYLQAFAHAVAGAEGATYDKMVGGKSFDDFSKHPQQVGLTTKDGPSTAAGRYQITATTAKPLAQQLNAKDFSPETQDRMFMQLLHQAGAMPELMAGNLDGAMQKVGGIWQGVPSGKSKNQGKRTPEQWQQLVQEGREAAGLNNMPAAGAAGAAGAPGVQAAAPAQSPAWLDPANGVEIIRPGSATTMAVPSPAGGPMREIPQAAYAAYRQAAAADPQLAARMQPINGGVMVDGAIVPAPQLAAGSKETNDYLGRVRAGEADVVDPQDVKRQVEAMKLDSANNRYKVLSQGNDPITGAKLPDKLFDTQTGRDVTEANTALGAQPTPDAKAYLKAHPDLAPLFDQKYGTGTAQRTLLEK